MSLLNPNQQPHLYQPLPTPRALLTSLLNSLSTSSPQPTSATDASPNSKSNSTTTSLPTSTNAPPNPLKTLSASQKSLLATLHVLFPPPTLLQALDLLDRGLVMRVRISSSSQQQGVVDSSISLSDVGADVRKDEEQETSSAQGVTHAQGGDIFYRVRSAQFQARSRYHAPAAGHADLPSGGLVYTVRLKAWNCDCAAFAFAAFPPVYPPLESEDYEQNEAWEGGDVGGLSFNGREGGEDGIPVCKHLLACLLAERWEGVLGTYVREWRAGREEGAGIAGS